MKEPRFLVLIAAGKEGELFRLMLEKLGFTDIILMKDGREGIKFVNGEDGRVDLIFASYELPFFSGDEVLEAARVKNPRVKGIIVTTTPHYSVLTRLKSVADYVFDGVVELPDLRAVIRKVLPKWQLPAY